MLYAVLWVNCKVYATQLLPIVWDIIFSTSTSNSNNKAGFFAWGNRLCYAGVIHTMLDCCFMWKRQLSYFLLWFLNHKFREDEEICHNSCKSKAIHKNSLTRYNTLLISTDVHLEDMWRFLLWGYPLFQKVNTMKELESYDGKTFIYKRGRNGRSVNFHNYVLYGIWVPPHLVSIDLPHLKL